uniref:Uncharacterized protein n=1 Tax=mine drainage metagenome TaxID=410659 RepID=E6QE94_9ZZZZ
MAGDAAGGEGGGFGRPCFAGCVPAWRAEGPLDDSRDAFRCRSIGGIFARGTAAGAGAGGDGGILTIRKAEGAAAVLVTSWRMMR